jgi:hypothetical protein
MIKDTQREQIATLSFPVFARTKWQKHKLALVEQAYQRSIYPRSELTECEFIHTYDTEIAVVITDTTRIIVLIGNNPSEIKELVLVTKGVLEKVKNDEERFFITKYSNPS